MGIEPLSQPIYRLVCDRCGKTTEVMGQPTAEGWDVLQWLEPWTEDKAAFTHRSLLCDDCLPTLRDWWDQKIGQV